MVRERMSKYDDRIKSVHSWSQSVYNSKVILSLNSSRRMVRVQVLLSNGQVMDGVGNWRLHNGLHCKLYFVGVDGTFGCICVFDIMIRWEM